MWDEEGGGDGWADEDRVEEVSSSQGILMDGYSDPYQATQETTEERGQETPQVGWTKASWIESGERWQTRLITGE